MKNLNTSTFAPYLVPIVTFLVIVALIPTIILPQVTKIGEKNRVLSEKEEKLDKLTAKVEALEGIDKEELDERVEAVEIALPSGKGLAPLVEGLKKIAGQSNLILTSVKLKPGKVASQSATKKDSQTQAEATKNNLVINIDLTGGVNDFGNFLAFVERAKRIVLIENFSASTNPTGSNFNLVVNAPFKPLSSTGNVTEEPLPLETDKHKKLYERLNSEFVEYSSPVDPCEDCTGVQNPFP